MKIIADTHTLFWFFTANKKLSGYAKESVEKADTIVIPTIVLLELIYLLVKKSQEDMVSFLYNTFKNDDKYMVIALDIAVIDAFMELPNILEMHDRIIVATAQLLKVPIVTKDEIIQQSYKNTIW